MPSIYNVRNDADLVRRNSDDPDVQRLAQAVSELARIVEEQEETLENLRRRLP